MPLSLPRAVVEAFKAKDTAALISLLGLRPWEINPLDAVGECPYAPTSAVATSWSKAISLRNELLKAVGECND